MTPRDVLALCALAFTAPTVLLVGLELGGGGEAPATTPRVAWAPAPVDRPSALFAEPTRASRARLQPAATLPAPAPSPAGRASVRAIKVSPPKPSSRATHYGFASLGDTSHDDRRAMWDRLVACEAPGRGWRYGAPGVGIDKGYRYFGGPNFTQETWESYGGLAFAFRAYDATPEQQITVAERVLAAQGWAAWPTCSRKLGFR